MSSGIRNEDLPESPSKKRKLKHPRTAKACTFCRRRKVRCSGTHPCDYCKNEGVRCNYEDGLIRPTNLAALGDTTTSSPTHESKPEVVAEGQLIGPASGVSLLYHLDGAGKAPAERVPGVSTSLVTHGDIQAPVDLKLNAFQLPGPDEMKTLLDRWFQFAMPTYRFLHRPALSEWASQLINNTGDLAFNAASKSACVLLACAQSLLYSAPGDRYLNGGDGDLRRSHQCYAKAKDLLDREPGPADLSSVQARLAMCLYLLSTFRMTECRFCFGFTHTVLISLGLHRRASSPDRLGLVEVESRRRTFWCAYVLDGYLGVMLGRPRLFRDEDIDQPYPRNFDDEDLISAESANDLPLHGNLEAFVGHIELAKVMAHNNDQLYPLKTLSEEQILARTTGIIGTIHTWKESLPDFLKPRERTLTGQRTFERQNTVLKLAHAHLSILATRRCLLLGSDFSGLQHVDQRVRNGVRECAIHISTVVNVTESLLQRNGLYQAYWFTFYVSLVAISTLYVFILQDSKRSRYDQSFQSMAPEVDIQKLFERARDCQQHLGALTPEGSQSHRHHRLLDQLRAKCEDIIKTSASANLASVDTSASQATSLHASHHPSVTASGDHWNSNTRPFSHRPEDGHLVNNETIPFSQFTPSVHDQLGPDDLGWGWEDLDTLGFSVYDSFDGSFLPQ